MAHFALNQAARQAGDEESIFASRACAHPPDHLGACRKALNRGLCCEPLLFVMPTPSADIEKLAAVRLTLPATWIFHFASTDKVELRCPRNPFAPPVPGWTIYAPRRGLTLHGGDAGAYEKLKAARRR